MSELNDVLRATFGAPIEAKRAAFVSELRGVADDSRMITFVSSTERRDRYGDCIRVAGWQTDEYMRGGGPVLWAHQSSAPPIGKTVSISKEMNPPALVQKVQFADAATYPFADEVYKLYRGGYLKSVSVGFRPLDPPKPILNEEGNFSGYEFTSAELLELSCVNVPANPDAVSRAIQKGVIASNDAARFFGSTTIISRASDDAVVAKLMEDPEALAREVIEMRRQFLEFLAIFGQHIVETKRLFEVVRTLVPKSKSSTLDEFIQTRLVQ